MIPLEDQAKLRWLLDHGFKCGIRDPRINTNYQGAYMVAEYYEDDELPTRDGSNGPWCIVGDDYRDLIQRAYAIWREEYHDPNPSD
jgi:hypothetical protein